jgi:uncharacterized membrane protein YdcZ (DUF606 family)
MKSYENIILPLIYYSFRNLNAVLIFVMVWILISKKPKQKIRKIFKYRVGGGLTGSIFHYMMIILIRPLP